MNLRLLLHPTQCFCAGLDPAIYFAITVSQTFVYTFEMPKLKGISFG